MRIKTILPLLLVFSCLWSFAACGGAESETQPQSVSERSFIYEDNTYGVSDENGAFDYGQDYIDKNLPEEYYIAYTVESGSAGALQKSEIAAARADGKIYFSVDGNETLFVPTDAGYLCYTKDIGEKGFQCINESFPMDEGAVSAYLTVYTNIFGYYTSFAGDDSFKSEGSETVAGRSCRKYVCDVSSVLAQVGYTIEFCIDKETGVCLRSSHSGTDGSDEYVYDFNCAEFKTSGISLPDV